jgi:cyclic pyranopterin monophosphate synthase
MSSLSHIDEEGAARQVDVSDKETTLRTARASCKVVFTKETWTFLREHGFTSSKGSIVEVARLAGIMAAKRTADIIPLCHPLALEYIDVQCRMLENANSLELQAIVRTTGKTGVEMEALTACHAAALTVYDMCKSLSQDMVITELKLEEKTGGKHDFKRP